MTPIAVSSSITRRHSRVEQVAEAAQALVTQLDRHVVERHGPAAQAGPAGLLGGAEHGLGDRRAVFDRPVEQIDLAHPAAAAAATDAVAVSGRGKGAQDRLSGDRADADLIWPYSDRRFDFAHHAGPQK